MSILDADVCFLHAAEGWVLFSGGVCVCVFPFFCVAGVRLFILCVFICELNLLGLDYIYSVSVN